MSDLASSLRWRRRLAWLLAAAVFADVNWWLGTLLPLTRPFLFLTTILLVSFFYGAINALLTRVMRWSAGEWADRSPFRIGVFLVLLLGVLIQEAAQNKPLAMLLTTALAGLTGMAIGECWLELRAALTERGRAALKDLHGGVRGGS